MSSRSESLTREISQQNAPDNQVVEHLQRELANSLVLYLNYKHYHWQTFGPLFRDLHLMWDEFAKEMRKSQDELAERLRMIGQNPIFSPSQMSDLCTVKIADNEQNVRTMVEEANENVQRVILDMREAARIADEQDDPGTNDLVAGLVQTHEKHEWFLRQILKKQDGLIS